MDKVFHDFLQTIAPPVNPVVMNGLATSYLPLAETYVDTVFRGASRSFPEGLTYEGFERCSYMEEYAETTRLKNNKRSFDLARSDLYMVKYRFNYKGTEIRRYIQLPYALDGGTFHLGGTLYHFTPVLTDKVISPGLNSIFVRLLRDKVNFDRFQYSAKVDGKMYTSQVIWSSIYRNVKQNNKVPPTTKALPTTVHYLLAKYGFQGMFEKFAGFSPIVGEDEINEVAYPKESWVICGSSEQKPARTYLETFYEPTKIKLAIPRNQWNNFTESLVIGFYYVVDHFPQEVRVKYLNNPADWKILLGAIYFSGHHGRAKLLNDIDEHYKSLDEYLDPIVIAKLHEIGYKIQDFYELLALVIRNFNDWVINANENTISVYGKTLEVLYYVLFDITSAIFRTNFKLNKQAGRSKASGGKELTEKEIIETMNKLLKPGAIFGLTRSNIAVSAVSYSGDHKYPKITSVVAQQQSTSGASRGPKKRIVVDATKRIHPSMVEAGSLLFLSKSNPTPMVRLNMYANIDLSTGTILPKPEFKSIREKTQARLRGLIADVKSE